MPAITYCSNVHPIRELGEALSHIDLHTGPIAQTCTPHQPFPVGLWLPETCLDEPLETARNLKEKFQAWNLHLASFNGFPMGIFHGESVKERVYLPDWSENRRLLYTQNLAICGAAMGAQDFSISSVSGGFKPLDTEDKIDQYHQHWLDWVIWADSHHKATSCIARLALEPEPMNTLEDHNDAIQHWEILREKARVRCIPLDLLNRHLGICFDTCHFSVRFIKPTFAWTALKKAGVPVHKIQVSVALRCPEKSSVEELESFFQMAEPVYLHQSYHLAKKNGLVSSFLDLPEASLAKVPEGEWRTHFHVPIHWGDSPSTTGAELLEFLVHLKNESFLPLLEIETYSFNALQDLKPQTRLDLNASIIQEWQWLTQRIAP